MAKQQRHKGRVDKYTSGNDTVGDSRDAMHCVSTSD